MNQWRWGRGDGGAQENDSSAASGAAEAVARCRAGDWSSAVPELTAALRAGHNDRTTWLYLASAYERTKRRDRARHLTSMTNEIFPASAYDGKAAFGVHPDAPGERDEMARFLAAHADEIRQSALTAMSPAAAARRIYVYWDAEPPPLVRACRASLRAHLPDGWELVELDAASIRDREPETATLCERIGLGKAHAADVIRTALLADTGGLWVDATVLVTRRFPAFLAEISALDFFLFAYRGSRTGNWFWWATPSSYRLHAIRAALMRWLESGRPWSNYFMFHDIVEMLYWVDDRYRAEWDQGLSLHPRDALAIHDQLTKPIPETTWSEMITRSPVNKLSWKFASTALDDPRSGASRVLELYP